MIRKLKEQTSFKRPVRYSVIAAGLRVCIACIDAAVFIGKLVGGMLPTAGRAGKKVIKKLFLSSILNVYFLFLKIRKRTRLLMSSGAHKFIVLFNRYVYRLTMLAIIIVTVASNVGARNLSAEELQSSIIINSAIGESNEQAPEFIEEGPLENISGSQTTDYLSDESLAADIAPLYAPDTDDDDLYATAEEDGTMLAPIITDSNVIPRDSTIAYTVEEGDTISTIAQRFDVSVNTILWQNNLSWTSTIRPGQSLFILPVSGVSHAVKSGETLAAIAKKYQADIEKMIAQNKLADAGDIRAGETLVIPDGIKPTAIVVAPRSSRSLPSAIHDIFAPHIPNGVDTGTKLLWPLNSHRITQYFTLRHSGIDIGDKKGSPIYAAESGKVERSGWTRGYGYNVIINHGNGLKTLYGHSSKLLVSVGDTVARGDTIALIGSTGWSTGPHLHFEVISSGRKTNPFNYTK